MKRILKYYFIIIFFIFSSCALDVPEDAFDYLAPPVITCGLSGVSGDTDIYVNFTGKNNEYYFDGYNVYVSETKMLPVSVASYNAVYVDEPYHSGTIPSYPLEPSVSIRTGTIKLREFWINNELGNPSAFVPGNTYWIMLGSYNHLTKTVMYDGVSNQVSIIFNK
jgi:hypothetical protein